MKYSYNNIREPWYPEEFKIIQLPPIRKDTYAISNYGRVLNIKTNNILHEFKGNNYMKIHLTNEDNTRTSYQVHILVAVHFIPRTEDDILNNRNIVNHKNLSTCQNYVHNLEWVNQAENAAHYHQYKHLKLICPVSRITNGGWTDTRGSKNGMSKLTEEQVHMMCSLLEQGFSYTEICEQMGLEPTENNRHLLSNLVQGTKWKHITQYYNLPKPMQMTDFSQYVIPVCKLLEQGLTNKEIIKILNMDPVEKSSRFINRKVYNEITKNYIF